MFNLLHQLELKLNGNFSSLLQHSSLKLVLLAIFLILLFRWLFNFINSATPTNRSPPSPPKLPVIGNLHQLGLHVHRSLQSLAQQHGPLMLLHFGSVPVLVVSSAEAAREIMKTHDGTFTDRPKFTFFKKVLYNCKDILSAPYGEYWRQIKSICVLNLLSNKRVRSFRAVREEESKSMINNIQQFCSISSSPSSSSLSVLNLSEMFLTLTSDIVCRVALGRKYSDRGQGGRIFKELSVELSELMSRLNIGDYIPWLAWFSHVNGLDAKLDDLAKRFDDFLEMVVQEHMDCSKSTLQGHGHVHTNEDDQRDFVDVLLWLQKENADVIAYPIDAVSIKAIILDMFAAGTDTIYTAIEWVMSELLRHPRVMKKLQNEVRGIAGNKTEITEDDLVGMHYLKAVIKETLRLHPPAPLLVPRVSTQDVKINDYDIKANTQVIVNAWAIGRDPKSYNNPDVFEPERFLNSAIDYKGDNFQYIPFGAGRRGCPGIQFALAVKEIALANLVHRFDWALPEGVRGEDLDMSESTGASVHRKYPLKAIAIPYSC
ncbi:putative cytochrome P450 [Rosa chinensis]|uniref:Putative cytochrome P450 n=1 Tax=Rosa chinensis TaxID=74649 RepID=A0A2P6PRM0_ROSCH|nr:cytochrome P450 736A117 [Rosa chinensis]PRQ24583.1 putative cytochrome P450 [Rosa chinensis]